MYFKRAIEQSPLQVYISGLVFSPYCSLAKANLKNEWPKWITTRPAVEENWGACLQTLEGHGGGVNSVVFSGDGSRLASASSDDRTVKIWDARSGACLQTLEVGTALYNIDFTPSGSHLLTDIGTLVLGTHASSSMLPSTKPTALVNLQTPQFQGWGITGDREWITYQSEIYLWLPPEYRPSCSAVAGTIIGAGVSTGKVWICSFTDGIG